MMPTVQVCYIDMAVQSMDRESIALNPGNLRMKQNPDMTLFSITDHTLLGTEPYKGVKMTITMKRKTTSEMLTTFFPSLLLMLITFATTFFKPFFFEAALSVNLTTMLVMTTIFISKLEGLPRTSYTKMIDYWLILCQLVPFTEVVLLTSMEYLRDEEEQGKEEKEAEKLKLATDEQDIITVESMKHTKECYVTQAKSRTGTASVKKNKLALIKTLKIIGWKAYITIKLIFSSSFRKKDFADDSGDIFCCLLFSRFSVNCKVL